MEHAILLGHAPVLQGMSVWVSPAWLVAQLLPPLAGLGLVQVLVWVMVPDPQDAEQAPSTQGDHPPLTTESKTKVVEKYRIYVAQNFHNSYHNQTGKSFAVECCNHHFDLSIHLYHTEKAKEILPIATYLVLFYTSQPTMCHKQGAPWSISTSLLNHSVCPWKVVPSIHLRCGVQSAVLLQLFPPGFSRPT